MTQESVAPGRAASCRRSDVRRRHRRRRHRRAFRRLRAVADRQKVVVLDRGRIAGGVTSRTTAHLAPVCDDGVSELTKMRGEEMAAKFQASQSAAVDRIEAIVTEARHCLRLPPARRVLVPRARHEPSRTPASSRTRSTRRYEQPGSTSKRPRAFRSRASRTRRSSATPSRQPSIRSNICAASSRRSRRRADGCSPTAR